MTNLTTAGGHSASILGFQIERQASVDSLCSAASARSLVAPSSWLQKMSRLKCKSPVPADIDIAQACDLKHIDQVAKGLDLSPSDYDLHGTTKAKVRTCFACGTKVYASCACTLLEMRTHSPTISPGFLGLSSSFRSWRNWETSQTANTVRIKRDVATGPVQTYTAPVSQEVKAST